MMIPISLVEEAHAAGLSVIPPAQDGTKRPYVPGSKGGAWKMYQSQRPPLALLTQWYDPRNGLTGIGLACGAVSGNLEVLDFDTLAAWETYRQHAEYCGMESLLGRIWAGYGEISPRGAHVMYRCTEITGNTKLARDAEGKATIETRGEGGYIIIAPSNGRVHPSGGEYKRVSGALTTILTITPLERRDLWELAKSLSDHTPEPLRSDPLQSSADPANKPGADFNARSTWADVLEPHGWQRVYQRGTVSYWRRPDKAHGLSATTGYAETDYLYVFSTSTSFEAERAYTKFAAFAILNHQGDFRAATRALGKSGYGESIRTSNSAAPRPQLVAVARLEKPSNEAGPQAEKEATHQDFIALADFINGPPKATYLVKGILPGQGLSQVFGSSNVGKSFLVIDLAMHIASGMTWRGFKTKKSPVLYIAAEGLSGLAGRMKAWTQRYGEVPEQFWIRPFPAELTAKGMAMVLAEKIRELPALPRLIILDTLAANFGPGSENDAEDMALALSGLRSLGGDWLVLCVHHSGHQDKERSRGHSSLFAALDTELRVSRDDPDGPIKVEHTKVRDGSRMKEALYFALEPEFLPWADEDGEPVNSAVLVPLAGQDTVEEGGQNRRSMGNQQVNALQVLRDLYDAHARNLDGSGVPRVTLRDWYAAMQIPASSNRVRIKNDLERRGFITVDHGYVYLS